MRCSGQAAQEGGCGGTKGPQSLVCGELTASVGATGLCVECAKSE